MKGKQRSVASPLFQSKGVSIYLAESNDLPLGINKTRLTKVNLVGRHNNLTYETHKLAYNHDCDQYTNDEHMCKWLL